MPSIGRGLFEGGRYRWLLRSLRSVASVQCVNNGLTSVRLAPRCHPAKFLRERVNSQTDYLGVNSDVYENPIQIYANGVARWTDLSPLHSLLSYYRNLQGATNTFSIATSVGLCLKRSVQLARLLLAPQ